MSNGNHVGRIRARLLSQYCLMHWKNHVYGCGIVVFKARHKYWHLQASVPSARSTAHWVTPGVPQARCTYFSLVRNLNGQCSATCLPTMLQPDKRTQLCNQTPPDAVHLPALASATTALLQGLALRATRATMGMRTCRGPTKLCSGRTSK